MLITRQDGTPATFLDISAKIDSTDERGLQALTFDPGLATNHFDYLDYTRKAKATIPPHNHIVRVIASGDKAVAGTFHDPPSVQFPSATGIV